jgi:hypothetical protein
MTISATINLKLPYTGNSINSANTPPSDITVPTPGLARTTLANIIGINSAIAEYQINSAKMATDLAMDQEGRAYANELAGIVSEVNSSGATIVGASRAPTISMSETFGQNTAGAGLNMNAA